MLSHSKRYHGMEGQHESIVELQVQKMERISSSAKTKSLIMRQKQIVCAEVPVKGRNEFINLFIFILYHRFSTILTYLIMAFIVFTMCFVWFLTSKKSDLNDSLCPASASTVLQTLRPAVGVDQACPSVFAVLPDGGWPLKISLQHLQHLERLEREKIWEAFTVSTDSSTGRNSGKTHAERNI